MRIKKYFEIDTTIFKKYNGLHTFISPNEQILGLKRARHAYFSKFIPITYLPNRQSTIHLQNFEYCRFGSSYPTSAVMTQ